MEGINCNPANTYLRESLNPLIKATEDTMLNNRITISRSTKNQKSLSFKRPSSQIKNKKYTSPVWSIPKDRSATTLATKEFLPKGCFTNVMKNKCNKSSFWRITWTLPTSIPCKSPSTTSNKFKERSNKQTATTCLLKTVSRLTNTS